MKNLHRELIQQVSELNHDERRELYKALSALDEKEKIRDLLERLQEESPQCPHCYAEKVHRHGQQCGLTRYKCTHCKRTFNALTRTPLARLRKKELWLPYLQCMLDSFSVRKAAATVKINSETAFRWRHRFSTLLAMTEWPQLSGIIEADETFFKESNKGRRDLKRRPRKRGSDKRYPSRTGPLVCVLTACDRSNHGFEREVCTGSLKRFVLERELSKCITKDALLVSDGAGAYKSFAKDHHLKHVVVHNKEGERIVDGCFHIQHINALHSRLKGWINGHFRGVSTQYLDHYLNWKHELDHSNNMIPEGLFEAMLKRIPL